MRALTAIEADTLRQLTDGMTMPVEDIARAPLAPFRYTDVAEAFSDDGWDARQCAIPDLVRRGLAVCGRERHECDSWCDDDCDGYDDTWTATRRAILALSIYDAMGRKT